MGRLQLAPEAVAVAGDRLVAIVRVAADGSVTVRDLANGRLQVVSASEISAIPSLTGPTPGVLSAMARATDAQWASARQRERAVELIDGSGDVVGRVARTAKRLDVSQRTVFRWLARFRDGPQTSSLLPRPRGTPPGSRRIDQRIERVIDAAINDVYLTRVRAKKEEVVRHVALRCAAEGLSPPSRKAVLTRLAALNPRLGRPGAPAAWGGSGPVRAGTGRLPDRPPAEGRADRPHAG
jgi:putative transposase